MYSVILERSAAKSLARCSPWDKQRIEDAIEDLARNPRPFGCKKLAGGRGWRIRVGSHRVVYSIERDRLTVVVVKIGDRDHIYD